MVGQPPKDTPFGLGAKMLPRDWQTAWQGRGIVMLVGGGTNKFVKWAACQSITLGGAYIAFYIAVTIVDTVGIAHLYPLIGIVAILSMIVGLLMLVAWLYTWITAFQGKKRLGSSCRSRGLTHQFFGSQSG